MGTPKRGRPVYRFLPIKITKHESSRNIIISSETSQYKIFFCWHRTFKIPPFLLLLVNTIIIVNNKLLYRGRKNFFLPATTNGLDREKLKRLVFSIEKEYNHITFGLTIVRKHMGGMMKRISELDGILKNSEKWCLRFKLYLRIS